MSTTRTHKPTHSAQNRTRKTRKTRSTTIGLRRFETPLTAKRAKREKTNRAKKHEFVRELTAKFAPKAIQPTQDFYSYINYLWLKNISLEKQQQYIVQIDDFRLAQDKVYHQLHELTLQFIRKHPGEKLAANIRNYYKTIIDMNPPKHSRNRAKKILEEFQDYKRSNTTPWKLLAKINQDETISAYAPIVWSMNPDEKQNTVYRSYLSPAQFGIIDINVYFDDPTDTPKDAAYKHRYRATYKRFVQRIMNVCLPGRAAENAHAGEDVYAVELSILDALGCTATTRSGTAETYNKITAQESEEITGVPWSEFARDMGFTQTPPFYITSNPAFLKCMSKTLVEKWSEPAWESYWLFIQLRQLARITRGWETIVFDYAGKFERGQQSINNTRAVSAALYLSIPFNTFLTEQYVAAYENPQAMKYVQVMCEDLKIVFHNILSRNTWLEPKTRAYALKKLAKCAFIYGKPDALRPDPDLTYAAASLQENMAKITAWRHARFVELEGRGIIDIPLMDWTNYPVKMVGSQAYVVNASYTAGLNRIYINLGYIQRPFVDLEERGIEYNLAHVGFTIAHELGHGFDDWGSKYGWDGNLHDWWTAADRARYKRIQADVVKQYEQFAARDGIKFDASIGIGEDLADIQSLAVCDEYLRDFQEKNADLVPIRYLGFEAFYTYFAFQQKQYVSARALSAQLKTNPHPLDKYRCNVPLSRSEIFRAVYNVRPGDDMWWHNTNTMW